MITSPYHRPPSAWSKILVDHHIWMSLVHLLFDLCSCFFVLFSLDSFPFDFSEIMFANGNRLNKYAYNELLTLTSLRYCLSSKILGPLLGSRLGRPPRLEILLLTLDKSGALALPTSGCLGFLLSLRSKQECQ